MQSTAQHEQYTSRNSGSVVGNNELLGPHRVCYRGTRCMTHIQLARSRVDKAHATIPSRLVIGLVARHECAATTTITHVGAWDSLEMCNSQDVRIHVDKYIWIPHYRRCA